MKPRTYFVWHFSDAHPYRVYSAARHNLPADDDKHCIYRGDDIEEARQIAKDANTKRRNEKQTKLSRRSTEERRARQLDDEIARLLFWNNGNPKRRGGIFG